MSEKRSWHKVGNNQGSKDSTAVGQHLSPISLFYAYAHEDEALRGELEKHLRLLQHQGLISTWHDRHIAPGADWAQSIDHRLNEASMILLLISPDFLASNYCYNVEMQRALERHRRNEAHVIPIILRPVDWQHSPFAHLQCLPRDGKPITEWDNRDAAFRNIVEGLRQTIEQQSDSAHTLSYRNYLSWLIERTYYLDPRGTLQTQRQVQVKMEEIYISLMAQRDEMPRKVDSLLLEEEFANLEAQFVASHTAAEEVDNQREHMLARFELNHGANKSNGILELAEAVNCDERIVLLGDPGSGKTTLLRYLALKYAQALLNGQQDVAGDLGPTRFPILIRIADYAEYGMPKGRSLSEFLSDYCSKYECPKAGLADLLAAKLKEGNCLILMDGLDEIVSADDRLAVVRQIEDFVRYHGGITNRFIITSRVVGYRSASLSGGFIHYTLQEMNEVQIRRFLEAWCSAVEAAQTPDLSTEMREITAKREIDSIMKAVQNSPGVRRLAANPLLLRTLALIHRSGAQLPQKRIELYKLAADVLARTWRTAQGVPEAALVDDNYLTRLLGKLAYWLHANKSTSLATEQEIYRELGQEWARIKGWVWDEDHPDIRNEVKKFLQAVREHTGLFVERAPKRYGFMHLTFEEYYAARYLVSRSKTRAELIRKHIHSPRWEEPILLALGFVGLDTSEDAAELLEAAVLAQGEDAQELNFAPSRLENLVGRDYLFALRCLGDQIPVRAEVMQKLIERLLSELLYHTGSARFECYQQALRERLNYLKGSQAGTMLLQYLLSSLKDQNSTVRFEAAQGLGEIGHPSHDVIAALLKALKDKVSRVREQAALSLGQLGQPSSDVTAALLKALKDKASDVRGAAIQSLRQLGQSSSDGVIAVVLEALQDKSHYVQMQAARALGQSGRLSNNVISALFHALIFEGQANLRHQAAKSLGQLGLSASDLVALLLLQLSSNGDTEMRYYPYYVTNALSSLDRPSSDVGIALLDFSTDEDAVTRQSVAYGLGRLSQIPSDVLPALLRLITDEDDWVRTQAARSLGRLKQSSSKVQMALLHALNDDDSKVRYFAAWSLGQLDKPSTEVISTLLHILNDTDAHTHTEAAIVLAYLGRPSNQAIDALRKGVNDSGYPLTGRDSAYLLGQVCPGDEQTIEALWRGLLDDHPQVRTASTEGLVQLGRRFPAMQETIEEKLVQAIKDPEFDKLDKVKRSAHQYAFDGLWLLVIGGELRQAEWWGP